MNRDKYALEIIIDLPIGFPINNIISLCIRGLIASIRSVKKFLLF